MSLERHVIELAAKDTVSPALKSIATNADIAGRKAEDAGRRATRSTQDWSKAAKATGAALGAVGILSSKIAGDAEASAARMSTAFSNVGLSVDDFHDKIKDLTGKGLKLAFDDEDVQDSLARLITTTGDAEKAMRDVGIAEDLARAQGISLAQATSIVNAAEAGRFRGLQQLGIQLDANATTEEAIAALQGRVAGQAEAYSKTTAASYERMANTAENYLETVGGFVNQHGQMALALGGVATAAGPAIDGIKAIGNAAKDTAIAEKALNLAMGPAGLAFGIGIAALALYEFTGREAEAAISTGKLNDLIKTNTDSVLANAAAYERLGILAQVDTETTFFDTLLKTGQQNLDTINDMQLAIQKLNQMGGGEFEITKAWDLLGTGISQADAAWLESTFGNGNGKISIDELTAAMDYYNKSLTLNGDQTKKLNDDWTQLMGDVRDSGFDGVALWKQITDILNDPNLTGDQLVAAFDNLIAHQGDYNIALQHSKGATDGLTDAQRYATTEWKASVPVISSSSEALGQNAAQAEFVATAYSAAWPEIALYTGEAKAAAGVTGDLTGKMADGATATTTFSRDIEDLARAFNGVDAAKNAYDMVVGFTDGMVKSIQTSKDWSDSISGALGTDFMPNGDPSAVLSLLRAKKIDEEDYNEVLKAQTSIYADNARAQEAAQIIQIKQADVIAAGTDATADYLEQLSKQDELQQQISLAYADPAEAAHIQNIADMAAGYHDMSDAAQEAFGQTVTSAAATDPSLAAVLKNLGLIKESTTDPTGWTLNMDTVDSQTAMDRLISSMDDLVTVLAGIYGINIDDSDAQATSGLLYTIGGQLDGLNGKVSYASVYVTQYNNEVQVGGTGKALGGVVADMDRAALGRMGRGLTLVGEHGPEMVSLPHGSLVTPNHATRYMDKGGGGDVVITGPITIVTNDPREFLRKTRELASSMERR